MRTLFVLYDGKCAFCRHCRIWLAQQAAFVPLSFIPFQSPEIVCRFPGIEEFHPEERLVVVSDEGELWRGEEAWIMCLWALRDYREWSLRLAMPPLRSLARRVCELVSDHRHLLSRWFAKDPPEVLRRKLAELPLTVPTDIGTCNSR